MSTTQSNKTTAVKAKKAPLSRVLDTTDLAEGLEALRALDTKYAIIPATSRETILDQCDSILAAPGGHNSPSAPQSVTRPTCCRP